VADGKGDPEERAGEGGGTRLIRHQPKIGPCSREEEKGKGRTTVKLRHQGAMKLTSIRRSLQ